MTYSEKLKDPRWQKKRLRILERDDFACQDCQSTENTLNVHHLAYHKGAPWEVPDEDLVTLCDDCHTRIENTLRALRKLSVSFSRELVLVLKFLEADGEQRKFWTLLFNLNDPEFSDLVHHLMNYTRTRSEAAWHRGWQSGKEADEK